VSDVRNRAAQEAADKASTYEWGFTSDIEQEFAPKGLSEETVRFISAKKGEPEWMLDWRLKAYRQWLEMTAPDWAKLNVPPNRLSGSLLLRRAEAEAGAEVARRARSRKFAAPTRSSASRSRSRRCSPASRARARSRSMRCSTASRSPPPFARSLKRAGVIFLSISEALREYPDLVKKWIGKVVPIHDNYFATLNSAVFSDGTFVYIPEGRALPDGAFHLFPHQCRQHRPVRAHVDRRRQGQLRLLSRRLHRADARRKPAARAVVELVALDDAEIKYSTVQNWYPGNAEGLGGIYNFVTKRALCQGRNSKVSWTQVETGSAITWKYPSCVLSGENSVGEFYSVAVTNNYQQADTGTKMIHLGKNSRSTIVSKGISAGRSSNTYRGLVRVGPTAENVRNHTQCDSLLLGHDCGAHTVPYIEVRNPSAQIEHEATTSKISDDQLFYAMQRGLSQEDAVALIVNGFAKEVLQQLPMEFAVEAQKLLGISLEGSVG
jgi:Fe-S cluster assembly protein SufB